MEYSKKKDLNQVIAEDKTGKQKLFIDDYGTMLMIESSPSGVQEHSQIKNDILLID